MKLVTPLLFMFARQQALSDFNKTREAYNAQLQRGKEMVLDEPAQAERVRRSENDTHPIVHCRVGYGGCNSGCNRVKTSPTQATVSAKKSHEKRHERGSFGEQNNTTISTLVGKSKRRFIAHKFSTGGRLVWIGVWKRSVLLVNLQSSMSQTRIDGLKS